MACCGGERGWPAVVGRGVACYGGERGLKLIMVSACIVCLLLSDGGGRVWPSLVAVTE